MWLRFWKWRWRRIIPRILMGKVSADDVEFLLIYMERGRLDELDRMVRSVADNLTLFRGLLAEERRDRKRTKP